MGSRGQPPPLVQVTLIHMCGLNVYSQMDTQASQDILDHTSKPFCGCFFREALGLQTARLFSWTNGQHSLQLFSWQTLSIDCQIYTGYVSFFCSFSRHHLLWRNDSVICLAVGTQTHKWSWHERTHIGFKVDGVEKTIKCRKHGLRHIKHILMWTQRAGTQRADQ